jgi:hypothetical protein
MAVKIQVVFWVVISYSVAVGYQQERRVIQVIGGEEGSNVVGIQDQVAANIDMPVRSPVLTDRE